MSDYIYPEVTPNQSSLELVSNTDSRMSPLSGAVQTVDRTGERFMLTLAHNNLTTTERRQLLSFLALLNGMQHRAYIRDFSYSGPSGTLSGISNIQTPLDVTATGWSMPTWLTVSNITHGVRAHRFGNDTNGQSMPSYTMTTVAGISYSWRVAARGYTNLSPLMRWMYVTDYTGGAQTGGRLKQVPSAAFTLSEADVTHNSITAPGNALRVATTNHSVSGDPEHIIDIHRQEFARCLLVDNGVNALNYSEQLQQSSDWTPGLASISSNPSPNGPAPDATDTADSFIEDSSTGFHQLVQSVSRTSATGNWTGSIFLKANTNQRISFKVDDGSDNGYSGYFDATLGTITTEGLEGSGAESGFATMHEYPNGWYRCRVTVNLPATATARIVIFMCDGASNTRNYTGDGSSAVWLWGAQLQYGGQLGRYVKTTTAAATEESQTGNEIFVKGLDSSTTGQLLAGDQVQIGDQLLILESDLHGDASGVGLLVVRNRIRVAPADEDPVVLYRPCGRFILAEQRNGMASRPGVFSDISLRFMEDIAS